MTMVFPPAGDEPGKESRKNGERKFGKLVTKHVGPVRRNSRGTGREMGEEEKWGFWFRAKE